jgi:succinyl-CoA synthetase alpha subunit
VQFGHAGALALGVRQTAAAKNAYLAKCGAHVPTSFDDFDAVRRCFLLCFGLFWLLLLCDAVCW